MERMGEVAYKLKLPEGLSGVHDVFHVSQLKKCHAEMADIPGRDTVPLETIQLDNDLTYEEKPVKILEFANRVTRSKVIKFCKVQWSHHTEDEATWERRKICSRTTLTYFLANPNLEGEIHLKGGRFVTSQIFNLECYTLDHQCISYFICILVDPRNSTQLNDPRRELGISIFSYLSSLKF